MKNINFLVVHCSDSPQGRGDNSETIHRWHKDGNGWDGIGYHAVILEDGMIEQGRPIYWPGAHVRGHNHESLGVCLIGIKDFTGSQFAALRLLLDQWCKTYPTAKVVGHKDLDPGKFCPNFDAGAWYYGNVER